MCRTNVLLSHRSHHLVAKAPWHRFEGHRGKQNTRGFPHVVWHQRCCRVQKGCVYACIRVYIYIYANPPWNLPFSIFYCVLQWFLLVFAVKSSQPFLHSFEDFGCLIMRNHDASCVDTMTYFDGICSVFNYRIVFPTKGFNSNIDRMRTALWPNVFFKLYIVFFQCFNSFLWHMKFWILYAFRSSRHFIWWSIW